LRKDVVLRFCMLALAWAHTFPATKHLSAFAESPSLEEAWKGFGSAAAVVIYLLPVAWIARALITTWRRHRATLSVAGWVMAVAHLVPAADHLPRLLASPSWANAWRGLGSSISAAWFVLPVPTQGIALRTLRTLPGRIFERFTSSEARPVHGDASD
jgi:hypothetical protein